MLGVLGVGEEGGRGGQWGVYRRETLPPRPGQRLHGVPACWAPRRDRAALMAGSGVAVRGRESQVPRAGRLASPSTPPPRHERWAFSTFTPGTAGHWLGHASCAGPGVEVGVRVGGSGL